LTLYVCGGGSDGEKSDGGNGELHCDDGLLVVSECSGED
jgi:hypothetical protein